MKQDVKRKSKKKNKKVTQSLFKCKLHPKYKALKRPRANCGYCWQMWVEKFIFEGLEYAK